MDLLFNIANSATKFIVDNTIGVVTTSLISMTALPVLKITITSVLNLFERPFALWVMSLFANDREFAKAVVKFIERQLPDSLGETKKEEAKRLIKSRLPMLSDALIFELIEFSVKEMNKSLKDSVKTLD